MDWLTLIEKIFNSVGVPSHSHIDLAIGKVKSNALAWWCALVNRQAIMDELLHLGRDETSVAIFFLTLSLQTTLHKVAPSTTW